METSDFFFLPLTTTDRTHFSPPASCRILALGSMDLMDVFSGRPLQIQVDGLVRRTQ